MGAGRKTKTLTRKERTLPSWTVNCSVTARNLRKSDLGGVIFGCKHSTIGECFSNQLFGLPEPHFAYVKNISPGLTLFLFNYSDRKLHGIFEAASSGRLNINPTGWTSDGAVTTPYSAQVRFRVWRKCQPLVEDQFAPIIADNYYESRLFWFELDRNQTQKLINLFLALPAPGNAAYLQNTTRRNSTLVSTSNIREAANDGESSLQEASSSRANANSKLDCEWSQPLVLTNSNATQRTWSSLFKTSSGCDTLEEGITLGMQTLDLKPRLDQSTAESNFSVCSTCQVEDNQLHESWEDKCESGEYEEPVNSACCISSSMPTEMCQPSESSMHNNVKETNHDVVPPITYLEESHESDTVHHFQEGELSTQETVLVATENKVETNSLDLQSVVAKLVEEIEVLKGSQLMQNQKISSLEHELIESKLQIQQLKKQSSRLAAGPCSSSVALFQEADFGLLHKPLSNLDDSVLIVGGYDGSSWLPAVDSYSLSRDLMTSHSAMTCVRSFPAVTKMNGEVFILGGSHDGVWYDTVESYNPVSNQWANLPSLSKKRGSLVGASLCGKIFACGGRDGAEYFSQVEIFDINIGRWIFVQSMHEKRSAPAAAEIYGALYVVGGYDGRDYLNSVERYDPREHIWTRMGSMSSRRGCHSLVTLNGKLYAMGGHDGSGMVSTVEILDPRFGSWMMAEPMNDSRGYCGATVINEKIYVMGGVKLGGFLDTTECYEEGRGWQTINLRALGRRCGFSAVALGADC